MARSDYPSKYQTLIDDETWAFIERSDSFYPPDTAEKTIDEQRAIYNSLCASFHAGYPDGVSAEDSEIVDEKRSIPIRTYTFHGAGGDCVVVYFHGGGYVVGGLESHDDVCAEICAGTGFTVVSVDYRLAPEHAHPDDFNDALAAFRHVAEHLKKPVVLCGDSAGANLAAAVSHVTRGEKLKPVGQVLIYGAFGSKLDEGSFIAHSNAPMLTTNDTKFYKSVRVAGDLKLFEEPTCAPLNASDFSQLPPSFLVSAECDPLSDDSRHYAEAINAAGGKAHHVCEKGLVHGYLRARHMSSRARDSFARIIEAVSVLGKGNWIW